MPVPPIFVAEAFFTRFVPYRFDGVKVNYIVSVLSDCVTSYDKTKIDEMLQYYESKGCRLITVNELSN